MRVAKTDAYQAWIDNLKDPIGRARVLLRVDRLGHGNPGRLMWALDTGFTTPSEVTNSCFFSLGAASQLSHKTSQRLLS
jgi:hypothetical protein